MPVTATIVIPLKNLNLLNNILMQVSNPNSPYYRHFISRTQAEQLFTHSNEFNYVLSILKADGFKIKFTAFSSIIVASGNAGMFNKVFGTNVYIYSNGTSWYYSMPNVVSFHGANIYVTNGSSILFQHPTTFVSPELVKAIRNKFQALNETFSIEPYPTNSLQTVYNITQLLNSGVTGKGKTIGILDFAGNPYIKYQLEYYDSIYGLPNPPNFTITPIGPYDPNMGIATGWDGEISLDVESSHTMAPGANITLYIANYNLNLAPVIAFIDQQDSVNTLSQSFSIPESLMSELPAMLEYLNVQLADYYYEIGSAMGITFSASTGDAGGSGYSSGPIGTVGYPSTSPFVTALGGTTTFLTFNNMGQVSSFYQTAWSNYGFVPNNVNYGGSTGGISSLEPKPWYQFSMNNLKGYPNGRMVPDLSLEASVFPGMLFVFGQNMTGISGGTSEASPLFAGLVTLIDSDINGSLGLVNPILYQIGSNSSWYPKVFYPITSGYNIPWITNYGYNLVTGFGALNAGEFASLLSSMKGVKASMLVNNFTVTNSSGMQVYNVYPGEVLRLTSTLSISNTTVKSGKVNFIIDSLNGIATLSAKFNISSNEYYATYTVPNNVTGIVFAYSMATYNGTYSNSLEELYFGYYITSETIMPQSAYYFNLGVQFIGYVTTINGTPVNTTLTLIMASYNILNNSYYVTGIDANVKVINGTFSTYIVASIPVGVTLIEANDSYLYLPLFNGFNLQNSIILGPEEVEPGAVSPDRKSTRLNSSHPRNDLGGGVF
ncbi:S53 family peptidase, partial [Ruminococcus sp. 25CYCFAH16]